MCWKGFSLPCSTRTWLFQMRISGYDQRNLYRPCTSGRLHLASWGRVTSKISLSSGPFWTHKSKTKAKYISISNILHLLSALVSITRVGTIWDSLVVTSVSYCELFIVSNFCLIVDSSFRSSRALTRSFEVSNPLTWTYFC